MPIQAFRADGQVRGGDQSVLFGSAFELFYSLFSEREEAAESIRHIRAEAGRLARAPGAGMGAEGGLLDSRIEATLDTLVTQVLYNRLVRIALSLMNCIFKLLFLTPESLSLIPILPGLPQG